MRTNIHLHFCGQCQQAFEFYKELLGGSIGLMLSYGDSPAADQVPADWRSKIVHANLSVNNIEVAGSDVVREQYQKPSGFHLLLQMENEPEAKRVFSALAECGVIILALQKTFWSACYGIVIDQFGTPWEINCAA